MSEGNPTTSAAAGKPSKPYPDFPLFPHATRRWAKKIRGQLHYFGPWDDPDGALSKYLEQKDALHAGRKPREEVSGGVTVKDVANAFLNHKQGLVDAGELTAQTWKKYKDATDLVVRHFGKGRLAEDVDAADFAALRKAMAKRWGVYRLADMIQHVRSIFKHAHDAGLLPRAVQYGPGFARPTKKAQRIHRAEAGPKLFTAEEVRALVEGALVVGKEGPELVLATAQMRAMILLGINCGFGNADCGQLPLTAVDLDAGIIDFPRPKTGIPRRCPLWPETVAALREVLAKRPEAKDPEDAGLFFLTRCRMAWARDDKCHPVAFEMRKLLRKVGVRIRKGMGFYTLRHTFRTVADETKDQVAADYIMGHEVANMSCAYRETISDARLKAVADHVRSWLFPPPPAKQEPEKKSEAVP